MADALGLGPSGAIRGGSSPFSRTNLSISYRCIRHLEGKNLLVHARGPGRTLQGVRHDCLLLTVVRARPAFWLAAAPLVAAREGRGGLGGFLWAARAMGAELGGAELDAAPGARLEDGGTAAGEGLALGGEGAGCFGDLFFGGHRIVLPELPIRPSVPPERHRLP